VALQPTPGRGSPEKNEGPGLVTRALWEVADSGEQECSAAASASSSCPSAPRERTCGAVHSGALRLVLTAVLPLPLVLSRAGLLRPGVPPSGPDARDASGSRAAPAQRGRPAGSSRSTAGVSAAPPRARARKRDGSGLLPSGLVDRRVGELVDGLGATVLQSRQGLGRLRRCPSGSLEPPGEPQHGSNQFRSSRKLLSFKELHPITKVRADGHARRWHCRVRRCLLHQAVRAKAGVDPSTSLLGNTRSSTSSLIFIPVILGRALGHPLRLFGFSAWRRRESNPPPGAFLLRPWLREAAAAGTRARAR
jgi:hypothetical protein